MAQCTHNKALFTRAIALVRQKPRFLILALLVLLGLLVALFCGTAAARGERDALIERSSEEAVSLPSSASKASPSPDSSAESLVLVVDVSGAVVNPGVYDLKEGARVDDAIQAAGGLAEDADTSALNRASLLSDGMKITVPRQGEVVPEASSGAEGAPASPASSAAKSLVNINTASAEELQTLNGVGPSTAEAIIAEREENGLFATTEDLMRVSGIGEKKFAKIKDAICV